MPTKLELEDGIPLRQRRPAQQRCMISLPPDEYARLKVFAERLDTSMPDTIITILNFVEDVEAERGA